MDPFEENQYVAAAWELGYISAEEYVEYWKPSGHGSAAFVPITAGTSLLFAGPNMYVITYYHLLESALMNSLWYDLFGYDLGLYDIVDFQAGL